MDVGQQFRKNDTVMVPEGSSKYRMLLTGTTKASGGYVQLTGRRVAEDSIGEPAISHYVPAKAVEHIRHG